MIGWGLLPLNPDWVCLSPAGAHFTRHQHSHATSCRHFNLAAPQAPISAEFPLGHASQPPQTGLAPHLSPAPHQPPALPAPPQFQDVQGPPFLPQALHQQYLIQQQLLEAQHRRILPHPRYHHTHLHVPLDSHLQACFVCFFHSSPSESLRWPDTRTLHPLQFPYANVWKCLLCADEL